MLATFKIVNFVKYDSLYKIGMKPLVYSVKLFEFNGTEWVRGCFDIQYYRTIPEDNPTDKKLYTLQFSYDFTKQNDTVYFAYSYPYTYSDLSVYLGRIS